MSTKSSICSTIDSTSKTTVVQLKSVLKGYGLSTRGTKECLVSRLREYADDRESWIK